MLTRKTAGLTAMAIVFGLTAVTYVLKQPVRATTTSTVKPAAPPAPPALQRVLVQPVAYVAQPGDAPEIAARSYLALAVPESALAAEQATVTRVHRDPRGATIITFAQAVDGIEVFHGAARVLLNRDNAPVAASGTLVAAATYAKRTGAFDRTPAESLHAAFVSVTGRTSEPVAEATGKTGGFAAFVHPKYSGRVKPVYFPSDGALVAAYYTEIYPEAAAGAPGAWAMVVAADTGAPLFRQSLVYGASYDYRAWLDAFSYVPSDSPLGTQATPHPTGMPDGYQPAAVAQNVVTLSNLPFSGNDPWLPPGAVQTVGNNVAAYLDLSLPWGYQPAGDVVPENTASSAFDYSYDSQLAPNANDLQRKAVATNLFVVTNFLHDWFYDAGFDERSGNPQAANFGRGGLEGDQLLAAAQAPVAGSQAIVPADGASPELRLRIRAGHELRVLSPAGLAGVAASNTATFGAQTAELSGELAILAPAGTTLGCGAFAPGTFSGKIAVLDRGSCNFIDKAQNAQAAGAAALIVVDNVAAAIAPGLSGSNPLITIPVMTVTKAAGDAWKAEVAANGSTISAQLLRGGRADRDEALDNTLVAHEWAHVMVSRLIGNGSGLANQQGSALAEGWADFVALLLTVREEDRNLVGNDQFQGVYAVGGYSASAVSKDGHYFGLRRVPYSTNTAKNAFTFGHVRNYANHPLGIASADANSARNAHPNNSGEIWAQALWECYASLLNAYPFAEAQDRMKRYLVQSLMLTPVDPTFIEARDALLAAAAANDPADLARFRTAFAKRGLGAGAEAPPRYSVDFVGVAESFLTGAAIQVTSTLDDSVVTCDGDGVLDTGETGWLRVTVRNTGYTTLAAFTGTAAGVNPYVLPQFPGGTTLPFPSLAPGAAATRTLPVKLVAATGSAVELHVAVSFNEPSLAPAQMSYEHVQMSNFDVTPGGVAEFAVEGNLDGWDAEGWERRGQPGYQYWHADDGLAAGVKALTTPWLDVTAAGDFIVSWRQRISFARPADGSYSSGGVIELTTDGVTWTDIFALGVHGGVYTQYLPADEDNPLAGRPAMTGAISVTPASVFEVKQIDFGSFFAGKKVRLRFRLGSAGGLGAYGWDLDRIGVTNAGLPFDALIGETSDGTACNRTPVALAGPDQVVNEFSGTPDSGVYTTVNLYGGMSYDPDGQALVYSWQQVGGPSQVLNPVTSAATSFTAPVAQDALFTFRLTVGKSSGESDTDLVNVRVVNNNRTPVAALTGPVEADERTAIVVVSGAASRDADGDAVQYVWRQVGGPGVAYSAPDAQLSFMAPEVTADTQLTFGLVVTDGQANSAEAVTSVTIRQIDRSPSGPSTVTTKYVNERAAVTLSADGSADPDGDVLLYTWTQKTGPAVTVTPFGPYAAFTAPEVAQDTTLTFELLVTAGDGAAAPVLYTVVVRNVNHAPVAGARWVRGKAVGEIAVLSAGKSYDPDLETPAFAWKQLSGPKVALQGADEETVTFEIPEEASGESLGFKVTVTDKAGLSSAAEVTFDVDEAAATPDPVTAVTKNTTKNTASGGCATGGSGSLLPLMCVLAWLALRRSTASLRRP